MARAWLEDVRAGGGARIELKSGLTMLGGPRGDVAVASSGSDCVHLWSDPPKLIFVGSGEAPRVNGRETQEIDLRSGDHIEWRGATWDFGHDDGQAKLVEVALAPAPVVSGAPTASPARTAGAGVPAPAEATWRRLKAGLVAEMALADRAVIKRWQEAVVRSEFDAEAASRELLAGSPDVADGDPRLAERSTRLMRDLLMSSVTRSPGRQVRRATRNMLAFVLSQVLILLVFSLLFMAGLLLVRSKFGHSIDAFLDGIVNFF